MKSRLITQGVCALSLMVSLIVSADPVAPTITNGIPSTITATQALVHQVLVDDPDRNIVSVQNYEENVSGSYTGSSQYRVNTYTSANQHFASQALLNDGSYVIAWQSYGQDGPTQTSSDPDLYGIYAQRYAANGSTVGAEFILNTTELGDQQKVDLAPHTDGGFVAVWASENVDGAGFAVVGRRFAADGSALSAEITLNASSAGDQLNPQIAQYADGTYLLVWQSDNGDGTGFNITARQFDSSLSPTSAEWQVNSYSVDAQQLPRVALQSDDDAVFTWESNNQDGNALGVYFRRFSKTRTALDAQDVLVNLAKQYSQQFQPDVAVLSNDQFVITFTSYYQVSGGENDVFFNRYNADGTLITSDQVVNVTTAGDQREAVVHALGTGFAIAWSSYPQDGSGYGIFQNTYDVSGVKVGSDELLPELTIGDQREPVYGDLANGGYTLVFWSEWTAGDAYYGVHARNFNPASTQTIQHTDISWAASIVPTGQTPEFMYRPSAPGASWITVPSTSDGVNYLVALTDLAAATYEYKIELIEALGTPPLKTYTGTFVAGGTNAVPADTLLFQLLNTPPIDGLTIDANSGLLSWTPSEAQVGTYDISIQVQDADGLTATSTNAVVVEAPELPVITALVHGNDLAYVGVNKFIEVQATDPVGGGLTYTYQSTVSLSHSGAFFWWSPVEDQVGTSPPITFTVTDANGNQVSQSLTLTILADSEPPVITSTPITQATLGQPYQYQIMATDSDTAADQLRYNLEGGGPGMAMSSAGLLTWTPTQAQLEAGPSYNVYVVVSDGLNNVNQEFLITITNNSNDTDGDGVPDAEDAFPNDPAESIDTDGDGIGNNADPDDDNDGIFDGQDKFPLDASESADLDGDGVGDNSDPDLDGDGVDNSNDAFPTDATESADIDTDGIGDNADPDRDGDGVANTIDLFPSDPTETVDLDGDGIGDNSDADRDGDGYDNIAESFPDDPTKYLPELVLSAPADNTQTNYSPVTVTGSVAGTNIFLTVNGAQVTIAQDGSFTYDAPITEGSNAIHVVAANAGGFTATQDRSVELDLPPTVTIDTPQTLITVGASPVLVTGTVIGQVSTFTVNNVPVALSGNTFTADVVLDEGYNSVVARAIDSAGNEMTASIVISMDTTPPYMTVETPADGAVVKTNTITVTGLVNDIVRGTVAGEQANVTVNGIQATVSNRSYQAQNIPLVEGENVITVNGADNVGNVGTKTITVTYAPPLPKHIELVSGNVQTAEIRSDLTNPLVAKLIDENGQPVAGKKVIFRVVKGDGVVGVGTALESQGTSADTDANGEASTVFNIGSRAGEAMHQVRATSVGFDGEVLFTATGLPKLGNKVSINTGNNQRGSILQPLPSPFVVAVTDAGANVVNGAQVEFTVSQGSGKFQNGQQILLVQTDSDGRATAHLTLGHEQGLDVHRVTAKLVGTSLSAGFTASGFVPADPGNTAITGVVMDNQDNPLPNVTVRVEGTTRQAVSDAQGQFIITQTPVGPVHLLADGSTTTAEGEWPTLAFDIVTVAGVENPLSSPIYMVKLNMANAQMVGLEDVDFTIPEVPGFKLHVLKDSVTFPSGDNSGLLSVTPVNANKVPMAPPNGMQPQFIVTIQPAGTKFDPPAQLSLPNVDGHKPGATVEMYSYDHDLEEFVAIGLGTVSNDGATITSNTGVGVIKAGWHCGSQPSGQGCNLSCGKCGTLDANACVCIPPDPSNLTPSEDQNPHDCRISMCDGSVQPTSGETPHPYLNGLDICTQWYCDGVNPFPVNKVREFAAKPITEQKKENCATELCSGLDIPNLADAPTCDASKCLKFDAPTCSCVPEALEDCNCSQQPVDCSANPCAMASENQCACVVNPATDNTRPDDCHICRGGTNYYNAGVGCNAPPAEGEPTDPLDDNPYAPDDNDPRSPVGPIYQDFHDAFNIREVVHPHGATVNYEYEKRHFDHDVNDAWGIAGSLNVVVKKTFGYPSNAAGNQGSNYEPIVGSKVWTYDYLPGSPLVGGTCEAPLYNADEAFGGGKGNTLDRTIVSQPDGTKIVSYHCGINGASPGELWRVGMVSRKEYRNANLSEAPVQIEEYEWDKILVSHEEYRRNKGNGSFVNDSETFVPHLVSSTVTRDNTVYKTTNENPDDFGNPQRVVENGPSGQRVSRTDYWDGTSLWILGQAERQYVDGVKIDETTTIISTTVSEFDPATGAVKKVTNDGVPFVYDYYASGLIKSQQNANSILSGLGYKNLYENYKRGTPQLETYPVSANRNIVISRSVRNDGTIEWEDDGKGYRTSYTHDKLGRLTNVTLPSRSSGTFINDVTITYGKNSVNMVRGSTRVTSNLDGFGRAYEKIHEDTSGNAAPNSPTAISVKSSFNAMGQMIYQYQPNDDINRTETSYDALGRVLEIEHPAMDELLGKTKVTYRYLSGNVLEETNERGIVTTTQFKSFGSPNDGSLSMMWTADPNSKNEPIRATWLETNNIGMQLAVTQGDMNNAAKRWTRKYRYNNKLFPVETESPEFGKRRFGHDYVGNTTSREVINDGMSSGDTNYIYDYLGRNTKVEYPAAGNEILETPDLIMGYDDNGNLTSYSFGEVVRTVTWNEMDNIESDTLSISGTNYAINYAYDALDKLSSITYPTVAGSNRTIEYNPDALGRARNVGNFLNSVSWNASNGPKVMAYKNGRITTTELNTRLLPKRIVTALANNAADTVLDLTYRYYGTGSIQSITGKPYSTPVSLQYDALERLKFAAGPWQNGSNASFLYDTVDNITHKQVGKHHVRYNYSTNKAGEPDRNRLENFEVFVNSVSQGKQDIDYDVYGNIKDDGKYRYRYDHAGNLRRVENIKSGVVAEYVYEGGGKRVRKTIGNLSETFVYDAAGNQFAHYFSNGDVKENVYLGRQIIADVKTAANRAETTYYHYDHLGSPLAATDETGALKWNEVHQPFGLRMNGSNQDQTFVSFTGHMQDAESDLIYMGGRFYNPTIGRFMSPDPGGVVPSVPSTFNRYSYASNNPYRYVDPNGRWVEDLALGVPSLVLGGVSFYDNVAEGNWGWAAVDAVGMVLDVGAIALPGIPGGVGIGISLSRKAAKEGIEMAAKSADNVAKEVAEQAAKHADEAADGAKAADSCAGGKCDVPCCFVAGTQVLTEDGYKNIEDIALGDLVQAKNTETGEVAFKAVITLFETVKDVYNLVVIDATGASKNIGVTDNHPFFVINKGWVNSLDLVVGDQIETLQQGIVVVQSREATGEKKATYNFEVEDFHTYYVTRFDVLVHNCPDGDELANTPVRNFSVVKSTRKEAIESGAHSHVGKPKPTPKKGSNKRKKEEYQQSLKATKPESHPGSAHPRPHVHNSNKAQTKRRRRQNPHYVYPRGK